MSEDGANNRNRSYEVEPCIVSLSKHKMAFRQTTLHCTACNLSVSSQGPTSKVAAWLASPCEVKDNAKVAFQDVLVYASHCMRVYRGLHYCSTCGAWKVKSNQNLLKPCPRQAPTAGSDALKRTAKGKPPGQLKSWPCP